MRYIQYLTVIFMFSVFCNAAAFETKIAEKQQFVDNVLQELNGDFALQQIAMRSLKNKGIQHDGINQKIVELIEIYRAEPKNKEQYNTIGWLVKGLAYSGDEQYRAYITELSKTSKGKIKKHAKAALKILDEAIILNPVLSQETLDVNIYNWGDIRAINIIQSHLPTKYKKDAINAILRNKQNPGLESQKMIADFLQKSNDTKLKSNLKVYLKSIS